MTEPTNPLPAELEGYFPVCKTNDLTEERGERFVVNGHDVALFLVEGEIHAVSNLCPHQHAAIICDGWLEDGYVVCPAHGWSFSLKTGKTPVGTRGLRPYSVREHNNTVYVKTKLPEGW